MYQGYESIENAASCRMALSSVAQGYTAIIMVSHHHRASPVRQCVGFDPEGTPGDLARQHARDAVDGPIDLLPGDNERRGKAENRMMRVFGEDPAPQ